MSYQSRVYRQRNPKAKDEGKKDAFFSKHDDSKNNKKGSFFQAKLAVNEPGDSHEQQADAVADSVVNQTKGKPAVQKKEKSLQRLATTKEEEQVSSNDERMGRDKEKPFQRKAAEPEQEKKDVHKKGEPDKEKKDVHKKEEHGKEKEKEKPVQKKDEPEKEKDKKVHKKEEHEKEKKVQAAEEPMKDKEEHLQKKDDHEKKEDEKKKPVQKRNS